MRALLQRVSRASVKVSGQTIGSIPSGLLILLGIEENDTPDDLRWLAAKIASLRIFSDSEGKMNLSIREVKGSALVVSQFTLHGQYRKGNRPSFIRAARPEKAIPLYHEFITTLEGEIDKPVERGEFGAMMEVELVNDGPVTLMLDSKQPE